PFTHVLRLLEPPVLLVHFVFFARQLAAHVTPLPGAKQLANAVSYSASHSRALAETRQIFLSAVACLMHAPVLGLIAGTGVVVVVGRGGVVVVVRWGVVHATTHASYFARATSRHAWSRPTHWPPSAIHWF